MKDFPKYKYSKLTLERQCTSLDNRQIEDDDIDVFYLFNILIKVESKIIVLGSKYSWESDSRDLNYFTMR